MNLPPKFWLGLQNDFDIMEANRKMKSQLNKIKVFKNKFALV